MTNIKSFIRILTAAGVVLSLAACNQKAEFQSASYVAFSASTVEVSEDAGYIDIPVYAYTLKDDGTSFFPRGDKANTVVTFEVVPGSAQESVNYTVEPATMVLSFNEKSEATLRVNVVRSAEGVIDDTKDLTIRLTSATNGYDLGGMREVKVNIMDADHPLAYMFGTYECEGLTNPLSGTTGSLQLTVAPVSGNYNAVSIEGFTPSGENYELNPVIGTVSGQVLSIAADQILGRINDEYDVTFTPVSSFSAQGYYPAAYLTFTIEEDGSSMASKPFGYIVGYSVVEDGQTYMSAIDSYFKEEAVFERVR